MVFDLAAADGVVIPVVGFFWLFAFVFSFFFSCCFVVAIQGTPSGSCLVCS